MTAMRGAPSRRGGRRPFGAEMREEARHSALRPSSVNAKPSA
jgi:hypothetical protein